MRVTVSDDEVVRLVFSEDGSPNRPTAFTFTVEGEGKLRWQYENPNEAGDVDMATQVADVKDGGLPLVEGQFAADGVIADEGVYVVADSGDVDVLITAKGAN